MQKIIHSGIWGTVALGAFWCGTHLAALTPFLPAKYQTASGAVAGALIAVAALHATPPGKVSFPK